MGKNAHKTASLSVKTWLGMTMALSAVLMVSQPPSTQALTVQVVNDDSLLSGVVPMFEAEGRIGSVNAGGNSTFEIDLGETTAAPAIQADFPWTSGTPVDFSVHYSPVTSQVTYSVLGATGSPFLYTVAPAYQGLATGEVYLRTRTVDTGFDSMKLSQLVLDGISLSDVMSGTLNGQDRQVMKLTGLELLDGWLLTGKATFSWDPIGGGGPPLNSQLAFQVKGTSPVPLPGAVLLFGSGLLGLAGALRKKFKLA
ncbi:MAG: hypothetical protein HXY51_00965 [Nitrospirae bacterium]|nr:hypothetical protein [Nitrospirota bacterium]